MSDLTSLEKRTLERLFQMAGGYVLDFSNRTFTDFLLDSVGIDPDDARFNGGSKANRLRAVWKELPNNVVAKLIGDLAAHATEVNPSPTTAAEVLKARDIQKRLAAGPPVVALEVLSTIVPDDFDAHMTAVRAAVEQGKAEEGIDRLHTCCVGYLRRACDAFSLTTDKKEPLGSLLGKVIKQLKITGAIQSEMAEHILKSNISVFERFDYVRNHQSLAHDNTLLSKSEAEYIVSHVANLVSFIDSALPPSTTAAPSSSFSAAR